MVNPDVSRQVPVPSLATGRVTEIDARLGDEVKKGQLLFKVRSTDMSGAYSDYRQAVKNEELTKLQLSAPSSCSKPALGPRAPSKSPKTPKDDNVVVLDTAMEHLGLLGSIPTTHRHL